jgi:hypothetical protein
MEGNRVKENDELVQALQMRVSKLEARSRRWSALGLAGVLLVLVGASRSETADPTVIRARTVEARDFLLKDEDGRVRARLSVYPKQVAINGKMFDMPPGKVIPGQAATTRRSLALPLSMR